MKLMPVNLVHLGNGTNSALGGKNSNYHSCESSGFIDTWIAFLELRVRVEGVPIPPTDGVALLKYFLPLTTSENEHSILYYENILAVLSFIFPFLLSATFSQTKVQQ